MNSIEHEECGITGSILTVSDKKQETDTNVSGIYKIINKVNGHYYVGSATKVRDRWSQHRHFLRRNSHPNGHLQRAWNKYEEKSFEFVFVENVDVPNLENVEQKYLDVALAERYNAYNLAFDSYCPTRGVPMSEDQKIKLSLSLKRYFNDPMALKRHQCLCRNKSHGNKISSAKIQTEKYKFQHVKSEEVFIGTKRDFYERVGTYKNLSLLLKGTQKTIKGWKLVSHF